MNMYDTLVASRSWVSTEGPHPILKKLKEGKENDEPGWLRKTVKTVMKLPLTPSGQLKSPERRLLSQIIGGYSALTPSKTHGFNMLSDHAYAWGTHARTIQLIDARTLADPTLTAARKERTDVGTSVFTCEAKRDQVFTSLDFYKRYRRHHHPEPLNDVDLRNEFLQLTVQQQIPYQHGAESLRIRLATASEDIQAVLQKTNGAVTWRELSSQLAGDYVSIACPNTVRKYVMALPDSEYETTRMQPLLNSQHRMRRFKWARMFHILWHGGKMVAEKVQFVTLQSDEKWFFCLVRRRFLKKIPYFGCTPVDHKVHHKKHIDKFMVFGMTAWVPKNNNWMTGGEAFKVILQRIGRMVEAKANSYGRVYGEVCVYLYSYSYLKYLYVLSLYLYLLCTITQLTLSLSLSLEWQVHHATNRSKSSSEERKYVLQEHGDQRI